MNHGKKTIEKHYVLTNDKTKAEWISLNDLMRIANWPVLYGGDELGYVFDKDGQITKL